MIFEHFFRFFTILLFNDNTSTANILPACAVQLFWPCYFGSATMASNISFVHDGKLDLRWAVTI